MHDLLLSPPMQVLEQPVRKPGQQPKLSAEGFVTKTESDGKTVSTHLYTV